MIKADFRNLYEYLQNFNGIDQDFEKFLKKFLLEMAFRVIAKVKPRTPVDTGALRSMWGIGRQELKIQQVADHWDKKKGQWRPTYVLDEANTSIATIDEVGNKFEITIWNGMDYASFVEYGTAAKDGVYMLTISMYEVQRQMPLRFQKAFKQYLINKGVT